MRQSVLKCYQCILFLVLSWSCVTVYIKWAVLMVGNEIRIYFWIKQSLFKCHWVTAWNEINCLVMLPKRSDFRSWNSDLKLKCKLQFLNFKFMLENVLFVTKHYNLFDTIFEFFYWVCVNALNNYPQIIGSQIWPRPDLSLPHVSLQSKIYVKNWEKLIQLLRMWR